MRGILMFQYCDGQSHKTVSTDHNIFWRERRAEADTKQGPSAYQPNALPLGQTGSLKMSKNDLERKSGQGRERQTDRETHRETETERGIKTMTLDGYVYICILVIPSEQ